MSESTEIVEFLLQNYRPHLHATDNKGKTPLHRVVYNRIPSIVELLLKHGGRVLLDNIQKLHTAMSDIEPIENVSTTPEIKSLLENMNTGKDVDRKDVETETSKEENLQQLPQPWPRYAKEACKNRNVKNLEKLFDIMGENGKKMIDMPIDSQNGASMMWFLFKMERQ